jgi:arylsulfatase
MGDQRAPGKSLDSGAERFHPTRVRIKRDPFEQAVGIDQKTAMGLGGALAAPMTAFLYDWNMLPIGQLLWEKELMSYKAFPPLQAPETYNLDGILKQIQSARHASE